MAIVQPKIITIQERLYPYLRIGSVLPVLFAVIFTIDLFLPHKTSKEILLDKSINSTERGKHNKVHNTFYWITARFHAQVSFELYREFKEGTSATFHYTPILKKVVHVEYPKETTVLKWRIENTYYLWILLAVFIAFSGYTSLKRKEYDVIGFNAAVCTYIGVLAMCQFFQYSVASCYIRKIYILRNGG